MAVKTVGHLGVHNSGVRFAVTGLALRNNRMNSPVAEGAGEILVLGDCLVQIGIGRFMTGGAELTRRGHGIFNLQRMMGRMTAKTVRCCLGCLMGIMTVGTFRDFPMHIMAECTGLFGMGAFIIGKILPRPFMTGQTRRLYVLTQIQRQRFMGIGMTGKTIFKLKM